MEISDILIIIGGIFGILGGISDLAFKKPLISVLGLLKLELGALAYALGIIGIIGGLIVLYFGLVNKKKIYAIIGSILALLPPCGIAILALIGSLIMKE